MSVCVESVNGWLTEVSIRTECVSVVVLSDFEPSSSEVWTSPVSDEIDCVVVASVWSCDLLSF